MLRGFFATFFCFQFLYSWALAKTQSTSCVSPLGTQNILVIAADYKNAKADSILSDTSYLRELFVGNDGGVSLADYLRRISDGKASIGRMEFLGPYHYAETFTYNMKGKTSKDDVLSEWEKAILKMADKDTDLTSFDRIVFLTPPPLDISTGK